MFVAMSKFVVANGMEHEVKQAFVDRPHLVDSAEGFVRMEVMNPEDRPEEFVLVTYWEDKGHWKEWYHGHHYKEAHSGIPKGLKLVPKSTEVTYFQTFAD